MEVETSQPRNTVNKKKKKEKGRKRERESEIKKTNKQTKKKKKKKKGENTMPQSTEGRLPLWLNGQTSTWRAGDAEIDSRLTRSTHTSGLTAGTLAVILPGAWCYRVSAGTGWPGVSILRVGELASLICTL